MANYKIMTGATLSYATSATGTYSAIIGLNNIPDIGSSPNNVEATTFDDLVYNSYVTGLQDLDTLDFEFNLELPSATANINVVHGLASATGDPSYYWKLTYNSGIVVAFTSKCRYSFQGGAAGDLTKFTLSLTPEAGLTITVPTTAPANGN